MPLTCDNCKRFSQTLNVKPFPRNITSSVCLALPSFIATPRNMQAIKCWLLFIPSSGHGSSQFLGVVVGDGAVGKVRCSELFTSTPSQPILFLDVPLDILYNKCLSRTCPLPPCPTFKPTFNVCCIGRVYTNWYRRFQVRCRVARL